MFICNFTSWLCRGLRWISRTCVSFLRAIVAADTLRRLRALLWTVPYIWDTKALLLMLTHYMYQSFCYPSVVAFSLRIAYVDFCYVPIGRCLFAVFRVVRWWFSAQYVFCRSVTFRLLLAYFCCFAKPPISTRSVQVQHIWLEFWKSLVEISVEAPTTHRFSCFSRRFPMAATSTVCFR
jgi:hypothetical protein